jgi:hypothetical protein
VSKSKLAISFGVANEIIPRAKDMQNSDSSTTFACEWTFTKEGSHATSTMYYKKYEEHDERELVLARKDVIRITIDQFKKTVKFYHNDTIQYKYGGVPDRVIPYVRLTYDRSCGGSISLSNFKISPSF